MSKARGMRVRDSEPNEPPGPLEQRDKLQREKQAAYDEYAEQSQRRQVAEHSQGVAKRHLRDLQSARAKGNGTEVQVEKARDALDEATCDYEDALERANTALDVTKGLEATLGQLYCDYFEVFAEEAEQSSKRADAVLNEFVAAYRRAQEAWAAAQVAWTPLCHAVRIANMGQFPLTDFDMAAVVTGWTARPPGIEVLDTSEAIEEAAALEGLDVMG
jgi:hypothetical protein